MNQKFLQRLLERMGHVTAVASNGAEAVDFFRTGNFDLIFMDVQMPEMDGYAATAAIRELEKRHRQAHSHHCHDRPRAERRPREVPGGRHGRLSQQAGPAGRNRAGHSTATCWRASSTGHASDAPSPAQRPRQAVWDRAAALDRVGGDESLLDELIELFFNDYPVLARRLTEALARGDLASLREPAHTLKGSLGAWACRRPPDLAQEIESASQVEDATAAVGLIDRFMAEIEMLQDVMRPKAMARPRSRR